MKQRNEEADADEKILRISTDAKATVKVGPFARGGKSRVLTKEAMKVVETQLERLPSLEKWFVDIRSSPPATRAESQANAARPDREGDT